MGLGDFVATGGVPAVLPTLFIVVVGYYLWPLITCPLRHLPGPVALPVFGNLITLISKRFGAHYIEYIKQYGKVCRFYIGRDPCILVADTDILKAVMVKEFPAFTNRRSIPLRGLLRHSVFDSLDKDWRRQRHLLTPAFTSGRLKKMIPTVEMCIQRFLSNLEEQGSDIFECKTLTGALTMDIIASTGFGLELDSQKDPYNPFLVNARKLFIINFLSFPSFMAFFAPFSLPLLDKLGFTLSDKKTIEFFEDFLMAAIEERKRNKMEKNDFLQLMLDAGDLDLDDEAIRDLEGIQSDFSQEDKRIGLSIKEIQAQAVLFMLAGYETSSSTEAFMMYSLAENPDVQEKLYQEITEVMQDYEKPNYEALSKMPYLDQCLQETLRLYPPTTWSSRVAGQAITVKGLHIPKDMSVIIPTYALQLDPEVWPDPYKFDPERFSPEAKEGRSPFSHLPFGLGPRQCIGMRLAMMTMKLMFVNLITSYKFLSSGRKMDLDMAAFARSRNGIWVKVEKR